LGRPWLKKVNPLAVVNWAAMSIVCPGDKLMLGVRTAVGPEQQTSAGAGEVRVTVVGATTMRKVLKEEDSVSMQALWVTVGAVAAAGLEEQAGGTNGVEAAMAPNMTSGEREAMRALLKEFEDVFPDKLPDGAPESRHGIKHNISLEPGAVPPAARPFRLSPAEADVLSEKMAELVSQKLVRPSSSPFGAPVVLVRKKDGSFRLCIDYRRLNEITRRDKFPLPLVEDLLERLVGHHYFSKSICGPAITRLPWRRTASRERRS